ncbi:MAG: hypothetical protein ABW019_15980 [Chitinophagaceae bacterium]
MKNTVLIALLTSVVTAMTGCSKSGGSSGPSATTGSMGIRVESSGGGLLGYPFDIRPINVYVNNELKAAIGYSTTVDCAGLQVDALITDLQPGSYPVAFVLPGGVYVDGTATIVAGQCAKVNLSMDQFYHGKVNYGTQKGSITFLSSRVLTGAVSIYVDNVYVGRINGFATYDLCRFNIGQENLSVPVSAGTHAYRAVDATYGTTWTNNNISVQQNGCSQVTLR